MSILTYILVIPLLAAVLLAILPRTFVVLMLSGGGALENYAVRSASSVLEALMSAIQAPIRMAAHSLFVIGGLTGWTLEWKSPPREASDVAWTEALRRFGPLTAVVAVALVAVSSVSPATTVTSCGDTSNSSAQICASAVRMPCPIGIAPV